MAVKFFYPTQDATIYFVSGSSVECNRNTGMDAILELNKTYEIDMSRILIKFNTTDISTYLSDNGFHLNNTQSIAVLKLYNATSQELPTDYTVAVYPVSQSWDNGLGKYNYIPAESGSVSWFYRKTGILWNDVNTGGGTYYTSSMGYVSKSLFSGSDLDINVTDIVTSWVSSSIPNEGFILKRSSTEESSTHDLGILNYFSRETNTIYPPVLKIFTNNATYSFTTSSVMQHYTGSNQTIIASTNLQAEYRYDENVRIDLYMREKYPRVSYVTTYTSVDSYNTIYRLPSTCSYCIRDVKTGETVIDFSYDYTRIDNDENGSYITFDMNNLMPDRYYALGFKYVTTGNRSKTYIKDDELIFRVTKNEQYY